MIALRSFALRFIKRPGLQQQSVRCFFEHRSMWFPTEDQEEYNIPLRKTFDFTPLLKHSKQYVKELADNLYYEHKYEMEPQHDDMMIQWKFDKPETYETWNVSADSDWKFGYSKCELLMSKEKTAIFRGYLNPTPPKDGRTTFAGCASMKSKRLYKAFFRPATYNTWNKFTHLIFKVRGDGRKYSIILNTPDFFDHTWHDYYSYPLYTHGGPYWQFEKIPFSKFYHAVHNRIQDNQTSLMGEYEGVINQMNLVSSVAITLMDTFEGPFQLELDFIGLYYDVTHFEKFAYESYLMPFPFI